MPKELTDNFEQDEEHSLYGPCPRGQHEGLFRDGYCPECRVGHDSITKWHKEFLTEDGDKVGE